MSQEKDLQRITRTANKIEELRALVRLQTAVLERAAGVGTADRIAAKLGDALDEVISAAMSLELQ